MHIVGGQDRATLHGLIIVYPNNGATYPFPKPYAQFPLILGEWWKKNVMDIQGNANKTGGEPILSDAYTINGQPGDIYPCSKQETFKMEVKHGKTYLLRIVNAVMDESLFFAVAKHKLMLPPGLYYMAANAYSSAFGAGFDNTTTPGMLHYQNIASNTSSSPLLPQLPPHNATQASTEFSRRLRSLASKDHPVDVPTTVDTHVFITVSVNLLNCTGAPCTGPFGKRFSASLNNVCFIPPAIDILQAYYLSINGIFQTNFPKDPPKEFDYTANNLPNELLTPEFGTRVLLLNYNASVEMVLQGTNLFRADNPGVWLMHYHLERYQMWGMSAVIVVKNGTTAETALLPPPHDLPSCLH
ncbi:hypothetical protein C2S53_009589 [Perilla frutescens var. hirtella]|uniref:laccase n=1 Tax=Perilla frutescens var. hirtella TaxID=608512 RepID=A0AAD4NWK9_PERFH|nr:hypothetical protein C2S53_009589 [Perilla frutescens var. hirtella]